jgi:hypothetical protein
LRTAHIAMRVSLNQNKNAAPKSDPAIPV